MSEVKTREAASAVSPLPFDYNRFRRICVIDIETYSEIDLSACGAHRYVEDESFEILLTAFAYDDEPVELIDHTVGQDLPSSLVSALTDPSILKVAHNAAFERAALGRYIAQYLPPEQWLDTMVMASCAGLPLSLGQVTDALGFDADAAKDRRGKALIRKFCRLNAGRKTKLNPNPSPVRYYGEDYPEDWKDFCDYCRQDVVAEREVFRILRRWTPPQVEHDIWCLDARINENGIRIDTKLASESVATANRYKEELVARAVALTGLVNPNSVAQIKDWLREQEGLEVVSLNKKVVADVVAQLKTDNAREFMAVRKELSKSSVKKFDAMLRCACADDHARGCFQFVGAGRTGRWAGRLVQLQNLSKNKMPDIDEARTLIRMGEYETVKCLYGSPTSTLSELVRTALIPEEGHRFLVSDFSAIEARVLAWIAGEEWALEEFRGAGWIYEATGAMMFGVPKESIADGGEHHDLRQAAKTAVLACGYGGGIAALKAFGADKMGMSEEQMLDTVDKWRNANSQACALWKALEKAAIRCVVRHTPQMSTVGNIRFDYENGTLFMTLPSGRRIAYFGARYEESRWKADRKTLSYMGLEQQSRKWVRLETWGGKLTENLVQSAARDVLRDKMLRLNDAGFDIRAHVHDEIIITEPRDGRTVDAVNAIMGEELPWAVGLPLRGAGYECDYYIKA